VQDKNTRFDLAIECGNLDVALETARAIDKKECWERLAQQGLRQGNHKVRILRSQFKWSFFNTTRPPDRRNCLPEN
jgi:hypothetical protein